MRLAIFSHSIISSFQTFYAERSRSEGTE